MQWGNIAETKKKPQPSLHDVDVHDRYDKYFNKWVINRQSVKLAFL